MVLSSQAYETKKYDLAIDYLDLAIAQAPLDEKLTLRFQKARYLIDDRRDSEAIACVLEIETSEDSLSNKQKIDCAEIKLISYARLQDADNAQECFNILKKIDPRLPKFVNTKDKLIVSNYSQIPNFEKLFKCAMIHTQTAENSSCLHFYKNGICVVQKRCECPCKNNHILDELTCDACGKIITRIQPSSGYKLTCDGACNKLESGGLTFCAARFSSSPYCVLACCAVVYGISEACKYCCSGGSFYGKCIEPFKNILQGCPADCEPIW